MIVKNICNQFTSILFLTLLTGLKEYMVMQAGQIWIKRPEKVLINMYHLFASVCSTSEVLFMLDIDCQSYSSIDHNINFKYTYILVSNMYCKYSRFTLQAEVWFLSCMV